MLPFGRCWAFKMMEMAENFLENSSFFFYLVTVQEEPTIPTWDGMKSSWTCEGQIQLQTGRSQFEKRPTSFRSFKSYVGFAWGCLFVFGAYLSYDSDGSIVYTVSFYLLHRTQTTDIDLLQCPPWFPRESTGRYNSQDVCYAWLHVCWTQCVHLSHDYKVMGSIFFTLTRAGNWFRNLQSNSSLSL